MDDESLQRMAEDKNGITTDRLEDIRQNEIVVSEQLEQKVLTALADGSVSRRQLSRITRLKRATVDAVVKSLLGRDMVKVVTVTNSSGGRPTLFVSLAKNDEKARQRRLKAMYKLGI